MTSPRSRFRAEIVRGLSTLPLRTPRGVVAPDRREAHFGYRGGSHERVACWVYRPIASELELLFGFYKNFTDDDLICKSVTAGESVPEGSGASIQFNGDRSVRDDHGALTLLHAGTVTVQSAISRRALVDAIRQRAPEANLALGGLDADHGWPFYVGNSGDIPTLIDRLALYVYAVEQAKRMIRGEPPLKPLYGAGAVEDRGAPVPPTRGHSQGFQPDASVRAVVEQRAMEVALKHYQRQWEVVRDVSATHPYDLHCLRGADELRVEVKGTTGDGSAVWLTRSEVEHARTHYPDVALFVVSGIEVTGDDAPLASGGAKRVIQPWRIEECVLEAITYACVLRNPPNA